MERFARNAGAFFNNLRQDIDSEFVRAAAPPPASAIVRRQLPRITIAADDLIESCNRECAICTDAIQVGDVMTRLPCAHLYHPDCIDDWFQRSCLCPVCRYELPTDDENFEAGRLDRMRHRKPRFAQYEVNRMSVAELKTLARGRGGRTIPRTINDKPSLIEYLVEQDCIELVRNSTVEQVKYRLSDLRSYNIKRLREVMNDAGVFYDRKEVVEKADMIRIFIASGRLLVLPEPQAEPPEVETVHSDDEDDENDVRIHVVMPSSTPRRHVNQVMEESSFVERGGNNHERQNDDDDADNEMEVDEPRPPRRDADGTRFRRDDEDISRTAASAPSPASANGNRPRAAPHPLPTAPVERSSSSASSLIETMMEQVATLGTTELTMLHETICQLLEDRNNIDPPSSAGRRGRYEF
jgi:hypothetical protein